jgi:tetratricopeptide (TPR) repeat protein
MYPGARARGATMSLMDAKVRLYGRDAEYRTIRESIDQIVQDGISRRGKVVLITGMSGVGKTALAQMVLEEATLKGFDVYQTPCEPFHEGMSFFPVREIVRQVAGRRSAGDLVAELFGRGSPQAEMASVSESLSADPSSRREALVATFTNVILGRFQHPDTRPILIFIDDLEHLDAGSADALICLVSRLGEGRVLLFGAYRSDRVTDPRHPLKSLISSSRRMEGVFSEVHLSGFDQLRFYSFVDVLLPGNTALPIAFYEKLYRETEGNPLFTREVLRMLSAPKFDGSPGSLSFENGSWRFDGDIELWDIPATVEEVIASRLEFLDSEERRKLDFAAVIGRRFAFEVLSGIIEAGEDDLLRDLEKFLGFDLIRELDKGDDRFEFSHGKIRDVLYGSLSGLRRRRIHGQVAAVITELMGSANEDWDALIGEHLYLAARYSDAFPYLLRAARNAQATGSEIEAVSLFRKALEVSSGAVFDGDDSRQSIRLELAEALITASECGEAGTILEQMTGNDIPPEIRMRALNLLGDALMFDGEVEQALRTYQESEELANRLGDEIALCEILCDLSELHGRQYEAQAGMDPRRAAEHREAYISSVERAYTLLPKIRSGQLRARILRNKAKLSRVSGELEEAEALYRESINCVDSRVYGHRFQIPYVKTLRRSGKPVEALRIIDRISAWSSQVSSRRSQAIAEQYRGMILMTIADTLEDLAEARKVTEHALRSHKAIGFVQGIHETEMVLGEIALRMDNRPEALDRFGASIGRKDVPLPQLLEIVAGELAANGEEDRAEFVRHWGSKVGIRN